MENCSSDVEKNLSDVLHAHMQDMTSGNRETERDTQYVKAFNLTRPKAIASGDNYLWTIKTTNISLTKRKNEKFCQFKGDLNRNFWAIAEYLDDNELPIRYKCYRFEMSENEFVETEETTVYENNGCGLIDSIDDSVYFFSKSQNSVRAVESHKTPKTLFHVQRTVLALFVYTLDLELFVLVAWDHETSIRLSLYNKYGSETETIPTILAANQEIRRLLQVLVHDEIHILQNDLNILNKNGVVRYTIPGGKDPHLIRDISVCPLSQQTYIAYQNSIDMIDEKGNAVKQLSFEGNDTIKSILATRNEMIICWASNTLDVYEKSPSK